MSPIYKCAPNESKLIYYKRMKEVYNSHCILALMFFHYFKSLCICQNWEIKNHQREGKLC